MCRWRKQMSNNTGGPAFPQTNDRVVSARSIADSQGMTLRDYFAAKAMQSMNLRPDYEDASALLIAMDAYALADAMLKAREQK